MFIYTEYMILLRRRSKKVVNDMKLGKFMCNIKVCIIKLR